MTIRAGNSKGSKIAARAVHLLAAIILSAGLLNGCGLSDQSSEPIATDAGQLEKTRLAAEQGGNLHYQNMVLAVAGQIVFNAENKLLSIANEDGSNSRALVKQAGGNLARLDDQLFFTVNGQAGALSKVNLDGTNKVRIGSKSIKYLICSGQMLYAIETDQASVIAQRPDGTGRSVLTGQKAAALALADGKLYITGLDDGAGVQAFDLASGEQHQVLAKRVSSLNISGEWLYYADPDLDFQLFSWSMSEKQEYAISEFSIEKPFITSNGYLYFISPDQQNRLFRQKQTGKQMLNQRDFELIIDDAVESFVVIGDYIYYQRPDSRRIYRVGSAGGKPLRIT